MSSIVGALNQPNVKQGVKYAFGAFTLGVGGFALLEAVRGKVYTKYTKTTGQWPSIADRVTLAFAQTSLVLSAAVTPVGVWAISKAVTKVFSSAQLAKVFGPNTTFEANWKHPRHVVSLVALGLALPMIVRRFFITPDNFPGERRLNDCILFTVITSRPVLHQGNQLAQRLIKYFK